MEECFFFKFNVKIQILYSMCAPVNIAYHSIPLAIIRCQIAEIIETTNPFVHPFNGQTHFKLSVLQI